MTVIDTALKTFYFFIGSTVNVILCVQLLSLMYLIDLY